MGVWYTRLHNSTTHSWHGTHSTTSIADLQFLSEFRNGLHFCIECFILCREGSQVLHHGCSRPLQGTHQVLSKEAREVREKERKKGVRENWEGQWKVKGIKSQITKVHDLKCRTSDQWAHSEHLGTCALASSPSFCFSSDWKCSMAEAEAAGMRVWSSTTDTPPLPSFNRDFSRISLCDCVPVCVGVWTYVKCACVCMRVCVCVCVRTWFWTLPMLDCRETPRFKEDSELASWERSLSYRWKHGGWRQHTL